MYRLMRTHTHQYGSLRQLSNMWELGISDSTYLAAKVFGLHDRGGLGGVVVRRGVCGGWSVFFYPPSNFPYKMVENNLRKPF